MAKQKKRVNEEELLNKLKEVVKELEQKPAEKIVKDNSKDLKIKINELKEALKQNIILERNLISKTEFLRELKQENQDLMNQQRLLEDDLIKQGRMNDELIKKIQLAESQIDQKNHQVKHLNMDLKVFDEKLANVNKEIIFFKKSIFSEKNKFALIDDQNKVLLIHLSKSKETIEHLNFIIEQLKDDLSEKTKSILTSHAKAELNLKIENDMLRKKINDLQAFIIEKEKKQQEVINYLNSGLDAVKHMN